MNINKRLNKSEKIYRFERINKQQPTHFVDINVIDEQILFDTFMLFKLKMGLC